MANEPVKPGELLALPYWRQLAAELTRPAPAQRRLPFDDE